MRREFICHRCGTANRPTAENCSYCGLQVAWRPRVPDTLRFWRWPEPIKERVGVVATILAVIFEGTVQVAWASAVFTAPLLAVGGLALLWNAIIEPMEGKRRE